MTFGRRAYLHLFVTRAMKDHLSQSWDLKYVSSRAFFLLLLTLVVFEGSACRLA